MIAAEIIDNEVFDALSEGKDTFSLTEGKDQYVIGSDGQLEKYDDTFAGITEEDYNEAITLQERIIDQQRRVDVSRLKQARDISEIKSRKLYLALNYKSFTEWCKSPELTSVGWRTAYNLARIADEVLPLLEKNNLLEDDLPAISNLYDLLPILSDDDGEEKFLAAMKAVKNLTNADAKEYVKEIRGISKPIGERGLTFFTCKATKKGETHYEVKIFSSDGVDYYETGTVRIKLRDWARWVNLFKEENVTYTEG